LGSGLSGKTVQIGQSQPNGLEHGALLELVVTRDVQSRWFVEAIAALPILLCVLVGLTVLRNRGQRIIEQYEFLAVVGATMLALLPLHSVIVPSEITQLTRADCELGLWLAVIPGLAVIRILLDAWSPVKAPTDEPGNGSSHETGAPGEQPHLPPGKPGENPDTPDVAETPLAPKPSADGEGTTAGGAQSVSGEAGQASAGGTNCLGAQLFTYIHRLTSRDCLPGLLLMVILGLVMGNRYGRRPPGSSPGKEARQRFTHLVRR
jgi:hypothetical protein